MPTSNGDRSFRVPWTRGESRVWPGNDANSLLAVGIFGNSSSLRDRIEALVHTRAFSARVSLRSLALSTVALTAILLISSVTPNWIAFAQSATRTEFEVASIKPDNSGTTLVHIQPAMGGRFNAESVTLQFLIQRGWNVRDDQIIGTPPWAKSARYDIAAKAAGNASGEQLMGPMLQALLASRFKLGFHKETRQLPIYALTVAKSGPRLMASRDGSCAHWSPFTLGAPSSPVRGADEKPACGFLGLQPAGAEWKLNMMGAGMAELASSLSMTRDLHRSVVDKTNLTGAYDIHLAWAMTPIGAEPAETGLSIFTALEEQLGLKLESANGNVELIVIDHVEKPDGN